VLIAWGDKDPWEPIELGRAYGNFKTVEEFVVLPDVGHCPQVWPSVSLTFTLELLIKASPLDFGMLILKRFASPLYSWHFLTASMIVNPKAQCFHIFDKNKIINSTS